MVDTINSTYDIQIKAQPSNPVVYYPDPPIEHSTEETFPTHKTWYRRYIEMGNYIPLLNRRGYLGILGTGNPLSFGAAFSFGFRDGVICLTFPFVDLTLGYE
jgi:hypothetical protein